MVNPTKKFCERLIESCESHSDKVAMRVVGDDSETFTYGEFIGQIRSVAYRLIQEEVKPGDRVAVIGENHPCWAIAYLASLYIGAICVPLDPNGEIETLTNFIEDSEAKVAFLSPHVTEKYHQIQEKLGRTIPAVVWRNDNSTNGFQKFEDWSATEFPAAFAEQKTPAENEDNAILIYTSGTTGKPKGVLLSHGNIAAELDAVDSVLDFTDSERVLSLLPLFHVYLQLVNLWLSSTKGAEVFYLKELVPDELSKAMIESKMTTLTSVPRLWYLFHKKIFDTVKTQPQIVQKLFRFMLKLNGFTRDKFNINLGKKLFKKVHDSFGGHLDLAVTAGSRFDESVAIDFHRLGFKIIQGYGLSETTGAATATYSDDNRIGSVGKAMFGAEVKLDKPDDNGEGEVLLRGALVFKEYYKNPEATAAAFTEDGWFKTGDLGRFDQDGHLYITGRAKDVIILPSGKNVHPEDLEVHYSKSPLVEELCVLGVEDKAAEFQGAEKLVAVVIPDFEYLKQKNVANSKEVIRFELDNLGRELPEYQRVRDYIVRAEPLPRTATRKLKRFELQKEIQAKGLTDGDLSEVKTRELTDDDKELLNSQAGKALISAINQQKRESPEVHPAQNLEIDLRLDSLARAEIIASMEQTFGFEFDSKEITSAFTVGEVIKLVQKSANSENFKGEISTGFNWDQIIRETDKNELPEVRRVVRDNVFNTALTFIFLKFVYLIGKIFLSLEVEGVDELKKLEKPFIVCPNHQSFIDPLVVCSAYSFSTLRDIFHVGASEYFRNFFTRTLANFLKVVPINADTQILKAMKAGAIGLKGGKILNIYPEGERAFDGELHPFKKGAAILAAELNVPIVPVALDGLHKVWARESNKIRLAKVKIKFGKPFYANEIVDSKMTEEEQYEVITQELKQRIQVMINEMRK